MKNRKIRASLQLALAAACAPALAGLLGCQGSSGSGASQGTSAVSSSSLAGAGSPFSSDFIPPSGKVSPPANANGQQGPWSRRLLTARSSDDGLTWTKTNTILVDQGDAPTVITDDQGAIFVYYVTYHQDYPNQTVCALSYDGGLTWLHKLVSFTGLPAGVPSPVDPAALLLPNGDIRLYYQAHDPTTQSVATYSALSSDGLNFVIEAGLRYSPSGSDVIAPAILDCGQTHALFAIEHGSGANLRADSSDGMTFTTEPSVTFPDLYLASNGIAVSGGYRMYLFQGGNAQGSWTPDVGSAFSSDGLSWSLEAGARLELDTGSSLESLTVRDAAVTRLSDGSILMIYITEIP